MTTILRLALACSLFALVPAAHAAAAKAAAKEAPAPAAKEAPAAAKEPAAKEEPKEGKDAAVAKVGSDTITAGQLDTHAAAQLRQLEEEFRTQRFELRKQALDSMIMERLVKAEAAKKSVKEEAYLKSEIDEKLKPPTDAEVKKLFDQSADRLPPGATIDIVKPQIIEFLQQQQKQDRAKALYEQLKKANGVQVLLSEPRKKVEAKGPSRGPAGAKVTIVEFSDFECPFCSRAHDTVEQVMKDFDGKVKLVFRQFPLSFHPHAAKAAEAALCAADQGKFWELHDVLFKNQKALGVEKLKDHAATAGLDVPKFTKCLDSGEKAKLVKEDQEAGSKVGVSGTPAFFINGIALSGAVPAEEFKQVIDQELANAK